MPGRSALVVGGIGFFVLLSATYVLLTTRMGQDWPYTLTISGSSSRGYAIAGHSSKIFRNDIGHETQITFVNATDQETINIWVNDFAMTASAGTCPVRNCDVNIRNLAHGGRHLEVFEASNDALADSLDSYRFAFKVALAPATPTVAIDPELEMDREVSSFASLVAVPLGLLLIVIGWWLNRRKPPTLAAN